MSSMSSNGTTRAGTGKRKGHPYTSQPPEQRDKAHEEWWNTLPPKEQARLTREERERTDRAVAELAKRETSGSNGSATPSRPPKPQLVAVDGELVDEKRQLPAPSNPMACARDFVATEFAHAEHVRLVQQGGQFYSWDGTAWPALDDKDVRTMAYRFTETATFQHETPDGKLTAKAWQPTQRKIADFIDALRAVAHIPTSTPSPSWFGEFPYAASEIVSCSNGLVHIPTRTLIPHSPRFYAHHAVPFPFNPNATKPLHWLKFLRDVWGDDHESIDTLQETFGYLAAGDTSQQKMFLMVGPKRGGKGTIARVLKGMIGAHNVAGPTLSSIGTNFGLAPLIGKPVAIISDARLGGSDTSIVAERLLSISGEDTLTVDRKYREPVTLQLPTRFLILSNELPRLADASGSLASRFIILMMSRSFYGREDTRLTSKLIAELPGIFNWALDGAERLVERDRFVQPVASQEALRELEDLGSPIGAFVRDQCVIGAHHDVVVDALYSAWKAWCTENGRGVTSTQVFGRDLRAAFPGIKVQRPRDDDGGRFRTYQGIARRQP